MRLLISDKCAHPSFSLYCRSLSFWSYAVFAFSYCFVVERMLCVNMLHRIQIIQTYLYIVCSCISFPVSHMLTFCKYHKYDRLVFSFYPHRVCSRGGLVILKSEALGRHILINTYISYNIDDSYRKTLCGIQTL